MENKKGYKLYLLFSELNKETAEKYNIPKTVPYDDVYKKRMNNFFTPIGISPYPEVLNGNKKG